jgi:NADP-dependent 3-hydroxy acid dehydrogenase YdfG
MPKNSVVRQASSGFGALTARRLADAGHTVYAAIRETDGRIKQAVSDSADYAGCHDIQLRTPRWCDEHG